VSSLERTGELFPSALTITFLNGGIVGENADDSVNRL